MKKPRNTSVARPLSKFLQVTLCSMLLVKQTQLVCSCRVIYASVKLEWQDQFWISSCGEQLNYETGPSKQVCSWTDIHFADKSAKLQLVTDRLYTASSTHVNAFHKIFHPCKMNKLSTMTFSPPLSFVRSFLRTKIPVIEEVTAHQFDKAISRFLEEFSCSQGQFFSMVSKHTLHKEC